MTNIQIERRMLPMLLPSWFGCGTALAAVGPASPAETDLAIEPLPWESCDLIGCGQAGLEALRATMASPLVQPPARSLAASRSRGLEPRPRPSGPEARWESARQATLRLILCDAADPPSRDLAECLAASFAGSMTILIAAGERDDTWWTWWTLTQPRSPWLSRLVVGTDDSAAGLAATATVIAAMLTRGLPGGLVGECASLLGCGPAGGIGTVATFALGSTDEACEAARRARRQYEDGGLPSAAEGFQATCFVPYGLDPATDEAAAHAVRREVSGPGMAQVLYWAEAGVPGMKGMVAFATDQDLAAAIKAWG